MAPNYGTKLVLMYPALAPGKTELEVEGQESLHTVGINMIYFSISC